MGAASGEAREELDRGARAQKLFADLVRRAKARDERSQHRRQVRQERAPVHDGSVGQEATALLLAGRVRRRRPVEEHHGDTGHLGRVHRVQHCRRRSTSPGKIPRRGSAAAGCSSRVGGAPERTESKTPSSEPSSHAASSRCMSSSEDDRRAVEAGDPGMPGDPGGGGGAMAVSLTNHVRTRLGECGCTWPSRATSKWRFFAIPKFR